MAAEPETLAPQPRKSGGPYVFPLPRVSTPSQAPKRPRRFFGGPRRGSAASLESEASLEDDSILESDAYAEFLSLISRPSAIFETLTGQRNHSHHGIPPFIRRKSSVPKIFMTADDEEEAPPPVSDIPGRPELNRTPFRPDPTQNNKKEDSPLHSPSISSPITRARNPVALNSPFTQRKRAGGSENVQPVRVQPLKASPPAPLSPVGLPGGAELGLLAPSPPPVDLYSHATSQTQLHKQHEHTITVPLKSGTESTGETSKQKYRGRSLSAGDIFAKLFRQAP
ncbi:hypothetical protein M427DRAFT_132593 [Gonapodya prolifera JEL478]|uniref:Uncharacterized protein n=1 Tax=Gonapodya prolifera (strain JEL478) TaxID=1344416 RepID=A0A139APK1_GONPJ|nr:hypothetical protein M427DRAFT_132593 [Gonapodya prolifera JEL478]|eukprot:KXS18652.1 hypothetical protein M427DRAFT_132593 [Gonapodya prolifera JEL478]